jgi:hypothetical protein
MISFPTLCEFVVEGYTNLLKYRHWSWYWTWIQLIVSFEAVRFLKKKFFSAYKVA